MSPKQRAARDRLVTKAEKLLALATSPNPHEANLAAERAFSVAWCTILPELDREAATSIMERALAITEALVWTVETDAFGPLLAELSEMAA